MIPCLNEQRLKAVRSSPLPGCLMRRPCWPFRARNYPMSTSRPPRLAAYCQERAADDRKRVSRHGPGLPRGRPPEAFQADWLVDRGHQRSGKHRRTLVADRSHRLSAAHAEGADPERTVTICVFHDLQEARTGDILSVGKSYLAATPAAESYRRRVRNPQNVTHRATETDSVMRPRQIATATAAPSARQTNSVATSQTTDRSSTRLFFGARAVFRECFGTLGACTSWEGIRASLL